MVSALSFVSFVDKQSIFSIFLFHSKYVTSADNDSFFLFQYVSKTPKTKDEVMSICLRENRGNKMTLRQFLAYGNYQGHTCKEEADEQLLDSSWKYELFARFVHPTGLTKNGANEYVVTCCYDLALNWGVE